MKNYGHTAEGVIRLGLWPRRITLLDLLCIILHKILSLIHPTQPFNLGYQLIYLSLTLYGGGKK